MKSAILLNTLHRFESKDEFMKYYKGNVESRWSDVYFFDSGGSNHTDFDSIKFPAVMFHGQVYYQDAFYVLELDNSKKGWY